MRYTLIIILLAISPLWVSAQKNNTFADIGINDLDLSHLPDASVTYNRKLVKNFGVGIGVQEYNDAITSASFNTVNRLIPGIFADLRGYLPVKKSLFFMMADFGMDLYQSSGVVTNESPHNNGFYTGLGIGYCYRITKHGMGPYISFKMVSDSYKSKQTDPVTQDVSSGTSSNGTLVIAVGFKF